MKNLRLRRAIINLTLALLVVSCASPDSYPPTVTRDDNSPTATSAQAPTVEMGVRYDGAEVAGQTADELRQSIKNITLPARTLIAQTGVMTHTLTFKSITVDSEATIDALMNAPANSNVDAVVRFDSAEIQQQLALLNGDVMATSGVTLQSSDNPFNTQFVSNAAQQIDTKAAEAAVLDALARNQSTVTLPLQASETPAQPTPDQLQAAINTMAEAWPGIVGVYVYNLDTDEVVASYNETQSFQVRVS